MTRRFRPRCWPGPCLGAPPRLGRRRRVPPRPGSGTCLGLGRGRWFSPGSSAGPMADAGGVAIANARSSPLATHAAARTSFTGGASGSGTPGSAGRTDRSASSTSRDHSGPQGRRRWVPFRETIGDIACRQEARIFRGSKSRSATRSLQPEAIGAALEATRSPERLM